MKEWQLYWKIWSPVIDISIELPKSAYIQMVPQKQAGGRKFFLIWELSHFFSPACLLVWKKVLYSSWKKVF